jgi:hypothetical protein
MSNGGSLPNTTPPNFRLEIIEKLGSILEPDNKKGLEAWLLELFAKAAGLGLSIPLKTAIELLVFVAKSIVEAKEFADPSFRRLIAVAVQGLFGGSVNPNDFGGVFDFGADPAADRRIGRAILDILSGAPGIDPGESLTPSMDGASHYVGAVTKMAMQGWVQGTLMEAASAGQVEAIASLDDQLAKVLGLENITNQIIGPLLDATAVQPLEWFVSRKYRHRLLRPAEALEAYTRGFYTWEELKDELDRQGFSDRRIEAWAHNVERRLATDDLFYQFERGLVDRSSLVGLVRDAGYTPERAEELVGILEQRRRDRLNAPLADAVIRAYVNREIDDAVLEEGLRKGARNVYEAGVLAANARYLRTLNERRLSSTQVAALVLDGVLNYVDYRDALEREGYVLVDAAALELDLRKRKDTAKAIEQHRKEQEEERAAEKLRRDQERADRLAEKTRADAQPALGEVRRAFVRGHVSIERLRDAFTFAHPGIEAADLEALVADAAHDRADFLEMLERRAAAIARDDDPALPLAVLEESVVRGITPIDTYARELERRKFDAGERGILLGLVQAAIDDRRQAAAARDAAAKRAAQAGISIPDFERAVRLGLRTVDQLTAVLVRLEVPDVQRALIVDLVRDDMRRDTDAAQKRAALEREAQRRAINLPLRRRAVLRGVLSRDTYQQALTAAGVSVDDQELELRLVDLELAEAQAAQATRDRIARELEARRQAADERQRQREAAAAAARDERLADAERRRLERQATAPEPDPPPTLTLAQVERAVVLGILEPDDLRAYLRARRYDSADIETLVAIVVAQIPDTRAGQTRQRAIATELRARGINLADLERAVLRGLRTLDDYARELADRGYGIDDVTLLRQLLGERAAVDLEALRKKVRAALAALADAPTLEELETAIVDHEIDVPTARAYLVRLGLDRDAALVYVRMVQSVGLEEA